MLEYRWEYREEYRDTHKGAVFVEYPFDCRSGKSL